MSSFVSAAFIAAVVNDEVKSRGWLVSPVHFAVAGLLSVLSHLASALLDLIDLLAEASSVEHVREALVGRSLCLCFHLVVLFLQDRVVDGLLGGLCCLLDVLVEALHVEGLAHHRVLSTLRAAVLRLRLSLGLARTSHTLNFVDKLVGIVQKLAAIAGLADITSHLLGDSFGSLRLSSHGLLGGHLHLCVFDHLLSILHDLLACTDLLSHVDNLLERWLTLLSSSGHASGRSNRLLFHRFLEFGRGHDRITVGVRRGRRRGRVGVRAAGL